MKDSSPLAYYSKPKLRKRFIEIDITVSYNLILKDYKLQTWLRHPRTAASRNQRLARNGQSTTPYTKTYDISREMNLNEPIVNPDSAKAPT